MAAAATALYWSRLEPTYEGLKSGSHRSVKRGVGPRLEPTYEGLK